MMKLRLHKKVRNSLVLLVLLNLLFISIIGGHASADSTTVEETPTGETSDLISTILMMAFIVGGFVLALLFITLIMFREGSKRKRKPPVSENKRLEIIWTIIPALIISYIAYISGQTLIVVDTPPEEGLYIKVIGHQWVWEFQYPDGRISISELWIEEGQQVIFEVTSVDVIHSFFLPDFKIKIDSVPNTITKAWFVAEPAGTYDIFCTEFCGSSHHDMLGKLIIFEKEEGRKPYGPPKRMDDTGTPSFTDSKIFNMTLLETGGKEPGKPWSIDPPQVKVQEGQNVSFRIINYEKGFHNFTIGWPYNLEAASIPSGTYVWLNFTAGKPTSGTPYWCSVPGHREIGMEGLLIVEGSYADNLSTGEPAHEQDDEKEAFSWIKIVPVLIIASVLVTIAAALRPVKKKSGAPEKEDNYDDFEEDSESSGPEKNEEEAENNG